MYIPMCCGCALAVLRHDSAASYAIRYVTVAPSRLTSRRDLISPRYRDTIQNGLWWYYTQLAVSVSGYLIFFKTKGVSSRGRKSGSDAHPADVSF